MQTTITPKECLEIIANKKGRDDISFDGRDLSTVVKTMKKAKVILVVCENEVESETKQILDQFDVRELGTLELVLQDGYGMTCETREVVRDKNTSKASCTELNSLYTRLFYHGTYV